MTYVEKNRQVFERASSGNVTVIREIINDKEMGYSLIVGSYDPVKLSSIQFSNLVSLINEFTQPKAKVMDAIDRDRSMI